MRLLKNVVWLVILSAGLFLLHACRRNSSPTDISDEDPPPAPVRCPQTQIPWPSLADSPWPMWRHDPQQTGRSQYTGPPAGQLVWAANPIRTWELETCIYFGLDSTLYYMAGREPLRGIIALHPDSTEQWRFVPGDEDYEPVNRRFLFITADSLINYISIDRKLCRLNSTGTLMSTVELPGDVRYIAIGKEGVYYFVTYDLSLYAMKADGSVLWNTFFDAGFYQFTAPVISPDGNTLYVPGKNEGIYAISRNGNFKWYNRLGGFKIEWGILVDNQGLIYCTPRSSTSGIIAVQPDGEIKWSFCSDSLRFVSPAIGPNGNFYLASRSCIVSLDYAGKVRWSCPFPAGVIQPEGHLTCDDNGTVYVQNGYGPPSVFAVDSTGHIAWTWSSPFPRHRSTEQLTIDSQGRLYGVSDYDMLVYVLE